VSERDRQTDRHTGRVLCWQLLSPRQEKCAGLLYIVYWSDFIVHNDILSYVIWIVFYNFNERNIKAPWRWCRSNETCRSVRNIVWYFNIYMCVCVRVHCWYK
jgi:hypothetical protein